MKKLLPLLLILAGCTENIILSDGDNRCEYQRSTGLNPETVESIRTIVVDVGTGVRREMAPPPPAPASTSMEGCENDVCMALTEQGCWIQVGR